MRAAAPVLGTFLICLSLLAFEIATVRTINFAIGPSFIYVSIALAMIGLTSASSMLSLVKLEGRSRNAYVLFGLCLAISVLLVLSNVFVVATRDSFNAEIRAAGQADGLGAITVALFSHGSLAALKVGLFLGLPYFLFGALLSYLFATSEARDYARLYAADLIGAAVGCVAIIMAMEVADYAFSVTVPALTAMVAGAAYVLPRNRSLAAATVVGAVLFAAMPSVDAYRTSVEPRPDPNYLVRDYRFLDRVFESWSGWNSFTRIGAVEWADGSRTHAVLSLGSGDGMAWLWPYDPGRASPLIHKPAISALLLDPPDDALVMFAGVGADMMSLKEHGAKRVVGVELNGRLIDAALALPSYKLAEFLADAGVFLEVEEGRSFLQTDSSKYDMILLSWSGATAVYYLGALAGTTQNLFTYEGLSATLDHLKSDGYAVILQANKVRMLAALRRYLEEHSLPDTKQAAIVLFRPGHVNRWDGAWDDNPLLIKPSGWSATEVARVVGNARRHGLEVAYAPGLAVHPEYDVYERILEASDLDRELRQLQQETGLRFDVVTDDRPFYLDLFDPRRYFRAEFWLGDFSQVTLSDIYHRMRVLFTLAISIVAFFLALAPLFFLRGPISRAHSTNYLAYFVTLGAGFMFIEIAVLQSGSILFGNPGLTFAVVLGAVILFTGIGSLLSNWSFDRGLAFNQVAMAVALYAVLMALSAHTAIDSLLGLPLLARVFGLCLLIAPGAVLMGHLFPQGIARARREDAAMVPWAWAINGATSASVAGLAPLIAQATGIRSLFLVGAFLYGGILLIPAFRSVRPRVPLSRPDPCLNSPRPVISAGRRGGAV